MELRTLRYFLVLTQEGTVSGAAKSLHVTQPTLSRQLSELEREFGTSLFERGSKRIRLTEAGVRLRDYATSIVALADKATADLSQSEHAVDGSVFIGCGESEVMRTVLRAAKNCRAHHPDVRFHLFSGRAPIWRTASTTGFWTSWSSLSPYRIRTVCRSACRRRTGGACSCAKTTRWQSARRCARAMWLEERSSGQGKA